MHSPLEVEHHEPGRGEAVAFFLKTRVFIVHRWWLERKSPVSLHPFGSAWIDAPVVAETKAELWTQVTEAEFPLTAGKVQNLRAACLRLHGLEIPAGEIFSFWKQLGRTTRRRGFTAGRELRSGCLVPNLGGGLCQLSGLLHAAAIKAGIDVVERHAHSRSLPGVTMVPENDATVFWNYVDLRFSAPFSWRLECRLSATHLVVSIRAKDSSMPGKASSPPLDQGLPVRASADGDCLTCGVISCFRHPTAIKDHAAASGHTAWLLDARWPEFDDWCQRHAHEGDRWLTPLDGQRWNKPNYAWHLPAGAVRQHATFATLRRSFRQRRLPAQGAVRQRFLLEAQQQLAETFARHLDPKARHVVVAQTLLPHLWKAGHLGGRTFDVLVNRWPLAELQARLDVAAKAHPTSETLADFRADPSLVRAETEALAAAARLITPHGSIAAHFGSRALLIDWLFPSCSYQSTVSNKPFKLFFPASALGRKGIHELVAALSGTDTELLVLGAAREGSVDPLSSIKHRRATLGELASASALVIPAWIEHEPRIALRALASGIPVIASRACGLRPHPLLTEIDAGDVSGLRGAIENLARTEPACAVA